jgi:antitoxin component of MazEF toxin-antitoxin module
MQSTIISIGNSKGIRIPKILLEESGIFGDIEIRAKKGELKITPIKKVINPLTQLSETSLSQDWNKPEEDKAWENL